MVGPASSRSSNLAFAMNPNEPKENLLGHTWTQRDSAGPGLTVQPASPPALNPTSGAFPAPAERYICSTHLQTYSQAPSGAAHLAHAIPPLNGRIRPDSAGFILISGWTQPDSPGLSNCEGSAPAPGASARAGLPHFCFQLFPFTVHVKDPPAGRLCLQRRRSRFPDFRFSARSRPEPGFPAKLYNLLFFLARQPPPADLSGPNPANKYISNI